MRHSTLLHFGSLAEEHGDGQREVGIEEDSHVKGGWKFG